MRILKKGKKQESYSIRQMCTGFGNGGSGCGAELLIEEKDFYQTSRSPMGKETNYYVTFVCPSCGVLTDVRNPSAQAQELAKKNGSPPPKVEDVQAKISELKQRLKKRTNR